MDAAGSELASLFPPSPHRLCSTVACSSASNVAVCSCVPGVVHHSAPACSLVVVLASLIPLPPCRRLDSSLVSLLRPAEATVPPKAISLAHGDSFDLFHRSRLDRAQPSRPVTRRSHPTKLTKAEPRRAKPRRNRLEQQEGQRRRVCGIMLELDRLA